MKRKHKNTCMCCSCRSQRGDTMFWSAEVERIRREKISAAGTGRVVSQRTRAKLKAASAGDSNPNKRSEVREKHREIQTQLWKDPEYRAKLVASHIAYENQPFVKAQKSIAHRRRWQDPKFVAKQMIARQVSQNKAEKHLQQLLDAHFPEQWKFVGDGQLIVAGKCPDFVHTSKPFLIELFGDYWHSEQVTGVPIDQHEQERIQLFEAEGYQTLIIWERQLVLFSSMVNPIRIMTGDEM